MESVCSNEDPEHNSKNFSKHILPLNNFRTCIVKMQSGGQFEALLSRALSSCSFEHRLCKHCFSNCDKNRGSPAVNIRSQYETFTACCKLFNLSVKLGSRLTVIHGTKCACCLFVESCKWKINIYVILLQVKHNKEKEKLGINWKKKITWNK